MAGESVDYGMDAGNEVVEEETVGAQVDDSRVSGGWGRTVVEG